MSIVKDWYIAFEVVERFEELHGEGESRGACKTIATEIRKLIGGFLTGGFISMQTGKIQHWWVEKNGEIIDPLAVLWMDKPYEHKKVRVEYVSDLNG